MEFRFRRAIFLKFSLCLWAVLLGYSGGFLLWEIFGKAGAFEEKRSLEISHQLRLSQDLLGAGKSRELVEALRHSLRKGEIDFFGWRAEGRWSSLEGEAPDFSKLAAEPAPSGGLLRAESTLVAVLPQGNTALYLGAGVGSAARAKALWREGFSFLAKDAVFFVLALAFLTIFFFQEILRALRQGPTVPRDFSAPRPRPVPKALRQQGEAPAPRTGVFASLQVRDSFEVDSEKKAEEVGKRFATASRLAERYGGVLVEQGCTGGSFLFPDPRLALSSARDWQSLLPCTVILSEGTSYAAAAGKPLYGSGLARGLRKLAALELEGGIWSSKSLKVPGFRETPSMGLLQLHPEWKLRDAIDKAKDGDPSNIPYFREDSDLTILLRDLAGEWKRESFLACLGAVRTFQSSSDSLPLADAYRLLLKKELAGKDSHRLSSVVALSTHLLQPGAVSGELEKLFLQVLALPDRRTKANAIEVFIHFFPEREIPALRPYLKDLDNRISANALVKSALERFDDKVVRKIDERLQGGSVAHVASALYALGEIALYYRRTDPLYLGTKTAFLQLFASVPFWLSHPNPMVRRQALVAASKLGDSRLNQKLQEKFEACEDEALDELFGAVYGWRRGQGSGKKAA